MENPNAETSAFSIERNEMTDTRKTVLLLVVITLIAADTNAASTFSQKVHFLSAAGNATLESFEQNEPRPLIHAPLITNDFVVDPLDPDVGIDLRTTNVGGHFATDGARYFSYGDPNEGTAGTIRFMFNGPVSAFGLNITDWGDQSSGSLSLTTNAQHDILIGTSPPDGGNGSHIFFGIVDEANPFSVIELTTTTIGDGIGIDEVYSVPKSIACDFDNDGDCDADDVDALTAVGDLLVGVTAPPADPVFDLNSDNRVDSADLAEWLTRTGIVRQFSGPVGRGDTNIDGDVDTDDITKSINNFTGSGGTGLVWSDGDNDGDGDVDTGDVTNAIINFTGAMAQNAGVPDLIYDPATGNVTIDADGTDMISFSLQNGPFSAADFSDLPAGLTDNIAAQVGWTSFNLFTGLTATADLGAILPAGLDLNELQTALLTATYGLALSGGGGGGRFDIIIPEPATIALLLGGMLVISRRWQ